MTNELNLPTTGSDAAATQPHTPAFSAAHDTSQDRVEAQPAEAPAKINLADDKADDDDFNADDYEYVRVGGVVRAIPKSSVQDEPETATQSVPKTETKPVEDPHFYVWLANGEVIRVKESDLPTPAGTNATYGHWQVGDKVYVIVNIVPVETIVKGGDK